MASTKKHKTDNKPIEQTKEEEVSEEEYDYMKELPENMQELQKKIDILSAEASDKILILEKQYNKNLHPHYLQRNAIAKKIPHFWLKTLLNHPILHRLLTEEDKKVLEYLEEIIAEDLEDLEDYNLSSFKLTFRFGANPWFENKELFKQFRFNDKFELVTTSSTPIWKPGKDLTKSRTSEQQQEDKKRKRNEEEEQSTFFIFFIENEKDDKAIGDIIKNEVWPDPRKFYYGLDDDDDDFDDSEEQQEGGESNEEE